MTLKNRSLKQTVPTPAVDPLEGLSERELLELRARIDQIVKTDLSRINLAEELGLQYRAGMAMITDTEAQKDVPTNQKAQLFNSVSKMLQDIIKSQKVVYSAERLKRFEAAFMKVLGRLPPESARVYFDLYGDYLRENPAAMAEIQLIDPELG